MSIISSTLELPSGWFRMYQVNDEAEAQKIAEGRTSFLYRSHVIDALYLFIPAESQA